MNTKKARIEKMFRTTVKEVYDLLRQTANRVIKKIMGNWNMKTLTLSSYCRSAKIWIGKAQELDKIDCEEERLRKKLKENIE